MLAVCDEKWGGDELRVGCPAVQHRESVHYLPLTDKPTHLDPHWGLYDQDGDLIDLGAYSREPGKVLVGQSRHLDLDMFIFHKLSGSRFIYGGILSHHYGHFICTTLSRLWYLTREKSSQTKILFHGHGSLDFYWEFEFFRSAFSALGIEKDHIVMLREPTVIDKLVVPGPSFEEQHFVYTAFREIGETIGRTLCGSKGGDRPSATVRPASDGGLMARAISFLKSRQPKQSVYITKSKMSGGIHAFQEEKIIEDEMIDAGISIISPEFMLLGEQIRLFDSGCNLAGMASSAFHTSVFSRHTGKLTCLNPSRVVNSNLLLLDKVCKNDTTYLYPLNGLTEVENNRNIHKMFSFTSDPKALARALIVEAFPGTRVARPR